MSDHQFVADLLRQLAETLESVYVGTEIGDWPAALSEAETVDRLQVMIPPTIRREVEQVLGESRAQAISSRLDNLAVKIFLFLYRVRDERQRIADQPSFLRSELSAIQELCMHYATELWVVLNHLNADIYQLANTQSKVKESGRLGSEKAHGNEAQKEQRRQQYLVEYDHLVKDGIGKTTAMKMVAKRFKVSVKTIQRAREKRDRKTTE